VHQITDPQFIVPAVMLSKVLGLTKGLSEDLQAKDMELMCAVDEIEMVSSTLRNWRDDQNDVEFRRAFDMATDMYRKVEDNTQADLPLPRLAGRQRNRNNVPADNAAQYYKRGVWYPLLDSTLSEMNKRFSSQCKAVLQMTALIPAKCVNTAFAALADCLDTYGSFVEDGLLSCQAEYERWQRKWTSIPATDRPSTTAESLQVCDSSIYPNISVLLRIFATIPVTTATAERSFSALRLLKTYLRATMHEQRLNGLALMAIHKDIKLNYDDVVEQYALEHNRRLPFI